MSSFNNILMVNNDPIADIIDQYIPELFNRAHDNETVFYIIVKINFSFRKCSGNYVGLYVSYWMRLWINLYPICLILSTILL